MTELHYRKQPQPQPFVLFKFYKLKYLYQHLFWDNSSSYFPHVLWKLKIYKYLHIWSCSKIQDFIFHIIYFHIFHIFFYIFIYLKLLHDSSFHISYYRFSYFLYVLYIYQFKVVARLKISHFHISYFHIFHMFYIFVYLKLLHDWTFQEEDVHPRSMLTLPIYNGQK